MYNSLTFCLFTYNFLVTVIHSFRFLSFYNICLLFCLHYTFAYLWFHIRIQSTSNNQITQIFKFLIGDFHFSTEFGVDKFRTGFFQEFKKFEILRHTHFDDFGDSVTNPTGFQGLKEKSIGDGLDGGMISAVKVFESKTIATGTRWGSGIDA